jgi:hypothetical protein
MISGLTGEQNKHSRRNPARALNVAGSWLIATMFTATALVKILSFKQFCDTISASLLFPSTTASLPVAILIIAAEFITAALLLISATRILGIVLATTLSLVFVGFHSWEWLEGLTAPCTCFGAIYKADHASMIGLLLVGLGLLYTLYCTRPVLLK